MNDKIGMNDLPEAERPRERLIQQGAESLSNSELLAILLRTGTQEENALQLANRLLAQFGGIQNIARLSVAELTKVKGLGEAKACQILAALELGRRVLVMPSDERPSVQNARDAAQLVLDMAVLSQEQVRMILLDSARRVIAIPTIYVGTVNMSVLRIAELYREALLSNSSAVILVHNHPSGDANPSPEDIELTRAMLAAGNLLDIVFIDHLIIGRHGWKSLREMGLGF